MSQKLINILIVLLLIIISASVFANSMTKPLSRDEHMYCTAGVLMAQGKTIYKDFSYVAQLPYHPLLCAAAFKITNTSHFLFAGRLISVVCDILTVFFLIVIFRKVFSTDAVTGTLLGAAASLLYISNHCVDYLIGLAWNHNVVILAVVASFYLFFTTDFKNKTKFWRLFIAGGLLTFAGFMRITTVLVLFLFLLFIFIKAHGSLRKKLGTALPYFLAAAIFSIWPAWLIAQAPKAFFLNIYRIPLLNSNFLQERGLLYDKLAVTVDSLTHREYLLLIAIAVFVYGAFLLYRRKRNKNVAYADLSIAALLPLIFFIIAYIPPATWKQYFAVPVPFLIISLAFPLKHLQQSGRNIFKFAGLLITVCVIIGLIENPDVLKRVPNLIKTDKWTTLQVHKFSEQIAQKIDKSKPVLTLAPLYALEGGCEIYPQFSAGAFVYRVADFMTEKERKITNTIGPGTLSGLIEKSAPSAVFLGTETEFFQELEQSLRTAAALDWEKHSFENGLVVYYSAHD